MICEYCNKEFQERDKLNRFCSRSCKDSWWSRERRREPREHICTVCGKAYYSYFKSKYCSYECKRVRDRAKENESNLLKRRAAGVMPRTKKERVASTCVACGSERHSRSKYCDACRPKPKERGMCEICGVPLPKGHRTLCSEECRKIKHARSKYPSDSSLSAKLRDQISTRIRKILKGARHRVSFRSGVVKFTDTELMNHLSKQFQPGMTWENYGDVWHIDHKIPVRAFNLECDHDIGRCWSLKNLQPLFVEENLKKGGNLEKPFQPALV